MSQLAIYNYGLQIVSKLQEYRHEFLLDTQESNIEKLVELSMNHIKDKIDLFNYEKKICPKEITQGDSMKWHLDDCAIYKHKISYETKSNNIKLDEKYSIYYTNRPEYSMIIYLSTWNKDFTGGSFCFVDTEIIPVKYKVLIFSSQEVHRVNEVKSGKRECILVKFYKKI